MSSKWYENPNFDEKKIDTQNWHASCIYKVKNHYSGGWKDMEVQLLRIDSRLLHGQVTTSFARMLSLDYILVVSDNVAQNPLQQSLMMQVAPPHIQVKMITVDKMIRLIHDERFVNLKVMILVENPEDACHLVQQRLDVEAINIGSLSYQAGEKMITNTIAVNQADVEAFTWLHQRGISLYSQKVATEAKKDFWPILEDKLHLHS